MSNKTIFTTVSLIAIATAIYFLVKKKKLQLVVETPSSVNDATTMGRLSAAKKLYNDYATSYDKKKIVSAYNTGLTLFDVDENLNEMSGTKIDPFAGNRSLDVSNPFLFKITANGFIKLYFMVDGQRKMYFFSPYPFQVQ